jgi:hypothetical protein
MIATSEAALVQLAQRETKVLRYSFHDSCHNDPSPSLVSQRDHGSTLAARRRDITWAAATREARARHQAKSGSVDVTRNPAMALLPQAQPSPAMIP